MKDKLIETVGRTWRTLGELGETELGQLARQLKERQDIVNQAIGWLAREDKIKYTQKNNRTMVSLVASEMQQFRNICQTAMQGRRTRRI